MLKIDVIGATLERKLAKARRMAGNLKTPMTSAGAFFLEKVEEGFDQQRDPYGLPWKPLADSTLRMRAKRGTGDTILNDTGKMLASLRVISTSNNATVKINRPAEYHQKGNPRLPQRRILPISFGARYLPKAWTQGIEKIFNDYVARMMK